MENGHLSNGNGSTTKNKTPDTTPVLFNAVKVFSATKHTDRDVLGEKVTAWIQSQPGIMIHELRTLQSSDSEFHCVSIIVLYRNGSRGG
jgi:hypothetical protein